MNTCDKPNTWGDSATSFRLEA